MKSLNLKSETLRELTDVEMSGVAGAAAEAVLSIACVTRTIVCVSVDNCPTNWCTTTAVCS